MEKTVDDIVKRAEGRMELDDNDWYGLFKCFLIDAVLFMNRRSARQKEEREAELILQERLARLKANEHTAHPARGDAGVHCEDRGAADGRVDDEEGRFGLVGGEDERADEQVRLDIRENTIDDAENQAGLHAHGDELLPVENEC